MEPPVRYGIVGTGMMGQEHIRNLLALEGAQITALCDPEPTSLDWARLTLGDQAAEVVSFADHRSLIDAGLCDAVVIASPNMTHHELLLDVIGTGIDVLVEKPLCTTVADCDDVIEAAATSDQVIWVGLEYRYMPPVAALIDVVRSGAIGELKMVAIREHRFPFLEKVGNWNRFNENTGGTLVEKCCHFFDLFCHITGAVPERVMASGGRNVNHLDERYDGRTPDIIDNAFVIIDFEGGVRASLDLCMFAEGSRNQEELSVVGDQGKAEAFLPSGIMRVGRRSDWAPGVVEHVVTSDAVRHVGHHHGASYLEHLDFLEAVRTRSKPLVTLQDGRRSVLLGAAAQASIETGRVVTLD